MPDNAAIQLRKKRDFSEALTISYQFFRLNFIDLSKNFLILAGPVIFIFLIWSSAAITRESGLQPESNIFTLLTSAFELFLINTMLIPSLVIIFVANYIHLYEIHGPDGFTTMMLFHQIRRKIIPLIIGILITSGLVVLGIFIFFVPGIYFSIALAVFPMVLVVENKGIFASIGRSFNLVRNHWWRTFGLLLMMSLTIVLFAAGSSIPAAIILEVMEGNVSGDFKNHDLYYFLSIATGALMSAIIYISYTLIYIALGAQYYHLVESNEFRGLIKRLHKMSPPEPAMQGGRQ